MKKIIATVMAVVIGLLSGHAMAQDNQEQAASRLPKMKLLGKFQAGIPNAGIYKMYDESDDIVCYVLMPDIPITKKIPQGMMYEGNSIGSISCVKVKLHVVPVSEGPFR